MRPLPLALQLAQRPADQLGGGAVAGEVAAGGGRRTARNGSSARWRGWCRSTGGRQTEPAVLVESRIAPAPPVGQVLGSVESAPPQWENGVHSSHEGAPATGHDLGCPAGRRAGPGSQDGHCKRFMHSDASRRIRRLEGGEGTQQRCADGNRPNQQRRSAGKTCRACGHTPGPPWAGLIS